MKFIWQVNSSSGRRSLEIVLCIQKEPSSNPILFILWFIFSNIFKNWGRRRRWWGIGSFLNRVHCLSLLGLFFWRDIFLRWNNWCFYCRKECRIQRFILTFFRCIDSWQVCRLFRNIVWRLRAVLYIWGFLLLLDTQPSGQVDASNCWIQDPSRAVTPAY